jgi:hypothetical protein
VTDESQRHGQTKYADIQGPRSPEQAFCVFIHLKFMAFKVAYFNKNILRRCQGVDELIDAESRKFALIPPTSVNARRVF